MTDIALATRRLAGRIDPVLIAVLLALAVLAALAPAQAVASVTFTGEALWNVAPFLALSIGVAAYAKASGADALIVSNHGGRQLDGAQSSIEALPAIVDAVGSRIEVHMDGGIRSGQDVLKAWALGARGTYIGRAFLYGLGAMGEAGVTKALQIIHKELDLTMAFCGRTKITDVDASILLPGTYPTA